MRALPEKLTTLALLLASAVGTACNAAPPPAQADELDVTVLGDDGVLTFEIWSDVPLAEGHNDIHVTVLHDGAPFTDSSISATVHMASMTHGGFAPSTSDLGSGEFLLHDVALDMPGAWEIAMYAESSGQLKVHDTAVLELEVP
jgi:hypothetical protein